MITPHSALTSHADARVTHMNWDTKNIYVFFFRDMLETSNIPDYSISYFYYSHKCKISGTLRSFSILYMFENEVEPF